MDDINSEHFHLWYYEPDRTVWIHGGVGDLECSSMKVPVDHLDELIDACNRAKNALRVSEAVKAP